MGKIAEDRLTPDDRWLERIGGLSVREATALRIGDALRIGTGATIPRSYAQNRARALFASALYDVLPESTSDLLTPDALTQTITARIRRGNFTDPERLAAGEYLDRHVLDWKRRYRLRNFWVGPALERTLALSAIAREQDGILYHGPISLTDPQVGVHDGLEDFDECGIPRSRGEPIMMPEKFAHILPERSIDLDDLVHPDVVNNRAIPGHTGAIGFFSPRRETIDAAVKRLLPDLESRLRIALQRIAADDVALNDAIEPVTFRKITAFEWLVRYQVLGESRSAIAKVDGVDRANVSRAVNSTATLIGLTLRREKGGRPKGKRSNTKRVQ